MTQAGAAQVTQALSKVRSGSLIEAFELLAERWKEKAPPAQESLQTQLPKAVWAWVLREHGDAGDQYWNALCAAEIGDQAAVDPRALPPCAATLKAVKDRLTTLLGRNSAVGPVPEQLARATNPGSRFALDLAALYDKELTGAAADAAFAGGGAQLGRLFPVKRPGIDEYHDLVPVSDDELVGLIGVQGYRAAFRTVLPNPSRVARNQLSNQVGTDLRRELYARALAGYRRRYRVQLKAARATLDSALDQHPAIGASMLVRDRMAALQWDAAKLKERSGLGERMVAKMMSRSLRRRGKYDSGRVASPDASQKLCDALGLDWPTVHLATLTVELPGASRTAGGHIRQPRYGVACECLRLLRATGAEESVLEAIQAQVDGEVVVAAGGDERWQEPYRQLIARERERLALS